MARRKSSSSQIINALVVILCIIATVIDIAYIYYKCFYDKYITITNYIGDQVAPELKSSEELNNDELQAYQDRCFIDVRLMSNKNKNGIRLQELKFNFFSDYSLSKDSYISAGMQQIGELDDIDETYMDMDKVDDVVVDGYYYYDSVDGVSYKGGYGNNSIGTIFNRNLKMTISIDNEPYQIQLTGKQEEFGNSIFGKFSLGYSYYHYGTLFNTLIRAVETSSMGFGDYYLSKCNLSKFFSVYKYENGKVNTENLADWIDTYCVVKVHYDENGAESVRSSMYGIIMADPTFGVSDKWNSDYWQETFNINLTEQQLKFRTSEEYNGNLLYLPVELINEINNYKRIKVLVNINLDNVENVVGFDYQAFKGLEIDTLTITSSNNQDLTLLNESLYDTNLKTLKRSSNINLILIEAVNNTFVEVELWLNY